MMFGGGMMFGVGLLIMLLVVVLPVLLIVALIGGLIGRVEPQNKPVVSVPNPQPGRIVAMADPQSSQKIQPAARSCAHCGADIQPDWAHCPQCGAPVNQ